MNRLDKLTSLLEDGEWHQIAEALKEASISDEDAMPTLAFLKDYGFAEVEYEKIRLAENFMNLKTASIKVKKHAKD